MTANGDSHRESVVVMFTGKGGVGKTTCAVATALHNAGKGKRTLAISNDGMPSLSHIFETGNSSRIIGISESLRISEFGEREIREMWDRKFGSEMYEVFSSFVSIGYEEFVEFMTSLLKISALFGRHLRMVPPASTPASRSGGKAGNRCWMSSAGGSGFPLRTWSSSSAGCSSPW